MGFDHKHYVPILKAKAGELRALKEASTAVRRGATPVLEVLNVPLKVVEGKKNRVPSKSPEAHYESIADNIIKNWGADRRLFVDGFYIQGNPTMADGREPISAILDDLRDGGVMAIPVAGLERYAEYNEAVRKAIEEDGRGVCIRIVEPDLESDDLEGELQGLMKFLGTKPSTVDLLIDYGPKVPPRSSIVPLINDFPLLKDWRSFALSSSAFPPDMSLVSQFTTAELDREEWTGWTYLRSRASRLVRMPTFSDYAINHPVLSDPDPRMIRMSGNIRYTAATSYVIARGEVFPRKSDNDRETPGEQYPKLAEWIIKHNAWCGPQFSWGDAYIQDCADEKCVGGGREWRAVGTSHHLAFVVQQLASLP